MDKPDFQRSPDRILLGPGPSLLHPSPLRGRIWRIGLMGHSSQARYVLFLLSALETILAGEGVRLERGAAVGAAQEKLA